MQKGEAILETFSVESGVKYVEKTSREKGGTRKAPLSEKKVTPILGLWSQEATPPFDRSTSGPIWPLGGLGGKLN